MSPKIKFNIDIYLSTDIIIIIIVVVVVVVSYFISLSTLRELCSIAQEAMARGGNAVIIYDNPKSPEPSSPEESYDTLMTKFDSLKKYLERYRRPHRPEKGFWKGGKREGVNKIKDGTKTHGS